MNWNKIYALSLRHIYLIKGSFPRILDLIYWPTIQIFLWGFISKFFTLSSTYFENTVGIILSAAILYDFLFRSSISYNMMFLEEIWSRNFTNLFIAPIKISEIITALTFTAIFRTLIGLVPASIIAIPLFGISIFKIGLPLIFLLTAKEFAFQHLCAKAMVRLTYQRPSFLGLTMHKDLERSFAYACGTPLDHSFLD